MITLEQLHKQNQIAPEEYQYLKWDFSDQDDINVINKYGKTMLWEAISKGKKDKIQLVKKLIQAGADVNIPARGSNESLLHLAVQIHWQEMVKLLIDHYANLDATDQGGRTPIYYAKKPGIINLLINQGCNLNIIDNYNKDTPLGFHLAGGDPREDLIAAIIHGYTNTPITIAVFQQTLMTFLKWPVSANLFRFLLSHHVLYTQTLNQHCDPKQLKKLRQIEQIINKPANPDNPNFFLDLLYRLHNPITRYSDTEALLTILAINAKKQLSYDFHPTFILNSRKDPNQFIEYLDFLKKTSKLKLDLPLRERFIFGTDKSLTFQGVHWLSGDILIEANEERVILFDSLGAGSEQVKHVKELLKAIFPTAAIYVDDIKRQNDSGAICFAFAIDDIRHSYTAHNYLGKEFSDPVTGLFDYMESQDQDTYPLAFMRTLQSRMLYDGSIYGHSNFIQKYTNREKLYPLGKNKPSWNDFKKQYEKHSGFLNKDAPNEKLLNLRIKEKLAAMCDLSIAYLFSNIDSQQHFEKLTKKFTIDKFRDQQQKTKRLH